ncbi:NUDIX domain-containing protein [Actinoplanes sp. NPDC051633]|uniref:NUDIX hydrolase n=1 Tax=Actinoplanes sp. NPDC051633 TaxID=3155670 RepID=UPI003426CE62
MQIRPIVLAAVRRRDDILVFEGRDETKDETFYRPLGGGIEFGETAVEALRREIREELAVELTDVAPLGVLENIFTAFGRSAHEIVFVHTAVLSDPLLYENDRVGHVIDEGSPVLWQPLDAFASNRLTLYPSGLLDLLVTTSGR